MSDVKESDALSHAAKDPLYQAFISDAPKIQRPIGKAMKGIKRRRQKLREEKFAKEFIRHGFNATAAYQAVSPTAQRNTAANAGNRLLNRDDIRQRIVMYMNEAGVNGQNISSKIKEMMSHDTGNKLGAWNVDRAINHARAILGLDAEKRSHLTVDKRSVVIHASVSAEQLSSILSKAKPIQPNTMIVPSSNTGQTKSTEESLPIEGVVAK